MSKKEWIDLVWDFFGLVVFLAFLYFVWPFLVQ